MPALKRAREGGKRASCLSNLKQMTLAWNMYADENDDRLVNGATGYSDYTGGDWATHKGELAWINTLDNSSWDRQIEGIKSGALWPYLRNEDIYRCPTGRRGQALTYSIMFSMNAVNHTEVHGVVGAHVKKRSEIKPAPGLRLVFIDEGVMTADAYAVNYSTERWWDNPRPGTATGDLSCRWACRPLEMEGHRYDRTRQREGSKAGRSARQLDAGDRGRLRRPLQGATGLLGQAGLYPQPQRIAAAGVRTCLESPSDARVFFAVDVAGGSILIEGGSPCVHLRKPSRYRTPRGHCDHRHPPWRS
jgi:hypothetical protein